MKIPVLGKAILAGYEKKDGKIDMMIVLKHKAQSQRMKKNSGLVIQRTIIGFDELKERHKNFYASSSFSNANF